MEEKIVRGGKNQSRADKDEKSLVRVWRVSAAGEEKDFFDMNGVRSICFLS